MAMRRAAFAPGTVEDSAKLRSLVEIAEEATADGRKVVVFSFFRAIARCHRMGQVRRVDVHRLLTEDSVDQRMLEILRVKADEFNEYARRSDLKDVTPDAVDISDLTAAREAATQAENERRIVEMERKRLRMEEAEREGR